jgi:hypothetical protein
VKTKLVYGILFSILLSGCGISFNAPHEPLGFNIEPGIKSFVIIDGGITFTPAIVLKKKRVGVVNDVKNQYLIMLPRVLQKQFNFSNLNDTTLSAEDKNKLLNKDPVAINNICNRYKNSIILILKDCYAGFRKQNVKTVISPDGKSTYKSATYSVFFETHWIMLQGNNVNEKTVIASQLHGDKIEMRLRGPGFTNNKNEIIEMAEQNALKVAQLFKY